MNASGSRREKPVQLSGELPELLIEDFRKEFNKIKSPAVRRLYVLAKLIWPTHMRIGEYAALTAAADLAGHHGVALLLETCFADKLGFVEHNRRLIRRIAEGRVAERLAAKARRAPTRAICIAPLASETVRLSRVLFAGISNRGSLRNLNSWRNCAP